MLGSEAVVCCQAVRCPVCHDVNPDIISNQRFVVYHVCILGAQKMCYTNFEGDVGKLDMVWPHRCFWTAWATLRHFRPLLPLYSTLAQKYDLPVWIQIAKICYNPFFGHPVRLYSIQCMCCKAVCRGHIFKVQ